MNRLISTTAIAASACLFLPAAALADCDVFDGGAAALAGDARCIIFNPGDGENLRAGDTFDGPAGAITVTNGAVVNIEPGDPAVSSDSSAFMVVGRNSGNTGTALISGAGSAINVLGSSASIHIGREGSTGNATVESGGALTLSDTTGDPGGVSLSVALQNGLGSLTVDDGTVSVSSKSGAFMFVGREGGNGTVSAINGSAITVSDTDPGSSGDGAGLTIGRDVDGDLGGTGKVTVSDSTMTVHSDHALAGIFAGRESGTSGELTLDGASTLVRVESGVQAGMTIGRDDGSFGDLTVTNGATLEIDAPDTFLQLGRDAGSTGVAEITNGGTVRVLGPEADSDVVIGGAFADLGRPEGGSGAVTVSGTGSSLEATGQVFVGAPESLGGGTSLGRLTVADGGEVSANNVFIGTGGVLDGNGGTITGTLTLDGGTISPGASPGILNVAGDFSVLGGLLEIEIGGTAESAFDIIDVAGDFLGSDPFDIKLDFIDGFTPEAGDSFGFLRVAGDTSDLAQLVSLSLIDVEVVGLPKGSEVSLALDDGILSARAAGVGAVPLPAPMPLLLAGLGLLGWVGRRRSIA